MSKYLEEAAATLRKAAEAVEREDGAFLSSDLERISRGFVIIAALEKGVLPAESVAQLMNWLTEQII
ncbi:MAG: hypothetical protein HOY79_13570 [Streptomyces sp.]|nr:hypothetical protein [Streptomyces sp.]